MTKTSLDWDECLQLSNNKEDLAKDLLDMLAQELPTYQSELKKAVENNDLNKLQQHSHKLHGACSYTGVPRLRQLTAQLESQTKSHQKEQLTALVHQIDLEINEVLSAIKNQ